MADSQSWPAGERPVDTARTNDVGTCIPTDMEPQAVPEVSSQRRGVVYRK